MGVMCVNAVSGLRVMGAPADGALVPDRVKPCRHAA